METTKTILSFDISSVTVGYAIATKTSEGVINIINSGAIDLSKTSDRFNKIDIFKDWLISTISPLSIDEVVIEKPLYFSKNALTVAKLLEINASISTMLHNYLAVPIEYLSASTARKKAYSGVNFREGNVKEKVVDCVTGEFEIELLKTKRKYDQCDAVLLAKAYLM